MRHHYTLCEWPKFKIMTTLSTDNIVLGGLNPHTLLMGMKKWYNHFRTSLVISHNINLTSAICSSH